jgi:hypothetical protein
MRARSFYGWRVAGAAFVLAAFGWGVGFYGPPVFLSAVQDGRGWPVVLVSTAVTVHFLTGAVAGANLPAVHRRLGVPATTKVGAIALAAGVLGWALAAAPWQLFAAAVVSGAGWGATSSVALNAVVSPWFVRSRAAALALAYNGGSAGGAIFAPLWVAAIAALGFAAAAGAIGLVTVLALWVLADVFFSRTPREAELAPDDDAPAPPGPGAAAAAGVPLAASLLWRDRRFLTLCAGMAFGLVAQVGLIAHLFSLLAPALGAQQAGLAMGLVTIVAIASRTLTGWLMPWEADRRLVASAGYAAQVAGSLVLLAAAGTNAPLLLLGVVLFGAGFGNAVSLPPLIAQMEIASGDVQRVVGLTIGIAQGASAFAPAAFGLLRDVAPTGAGAAAGAAPYVFAAAALLQASAVAAFLAGRRRAMSQL